MPIKLSEVNLLKSDIAIINVKTSVTVSKKNGSSRIQVL